MAVALCVGFSQLRLNSHLTATLHFLLLKKQHGAILSSFSTCHDDTLRLFKVLNTERAHKRENTPREMQNQVSLDNFYLFVCTT